MSSRSKCHLNSSTEPKRPFVQQNVTIIYFSEWLNRIIECDGWSIIIIISYSERLNRLVEKNGWIGNIIEKQLCASSVHKLNPLSRLVSVYSVGFSPSNNNNNNNSLLPSVVLYHIGQSYSTMHQRFRTHRLSGVIRYNKLK